MCVEENGWTYRSALGASLAAAFKGSRALGASSGVFASHDDDVVDVVGGGGKIPTKTQKSNFYLQQVEMGVVVIVVWDDGLLISILAKMGG